MSVDLRSGVDLAPAVEAKRRAEADNGSPACPACALLDSGAAALTKAHEAGLATITMPLDVLAVLIEGAGAYHANTGDCARTKLARLAGKGEAP